MKTTRNSDGSMYTTSEWFIARITAICPKDPADPCSNWRCSWQQMVYCANMQGLTDVESGVLYGDCEEGLNVAVPIDGNEPALDEIVLMRWRAAVDQEENVFEFVRSGAGATYSDSCCRVLNVDCSQGFLSVLYSDACVQTTTSTTSTTPQPGNFISINGGGDALLINGTDSLLFG